MATSCSIPEEELRAFDCGELLAPTTTTTMPGKAAGAYEECIAGGG